MDAATAMDHVRSSEEAAGRALALDPSQALAVAVQGQNAAEYDRIKALDLLDRAVEMAPNHAGILMWAGNDLFIAGAYLDEALPLLERAYRLDPLSGINNGILGIAYISAGQRELGYQHVRRANELGWIHASGIAVLDLLWTGETDAAIEFGQAYWSDESPDWTDDLSTVRDIEQKVMRREISSDEVAEVLATTNLSEIELSWAVYYYQLLGDYDRMFDAWLAMDYDYEFLFRDVYLPSGRAVMEHPRMIEVAEKQLLFPLWESKGYPFGCERVQDDIGDHLSCPNWPQ
jgi:tetratricopeptide (TPR) repeat protein